MKQSPEDDILRGLAEGSIFWPDREPFTPGDPIWRICKLDYQHDFDGRRIFQHRNFLKWGPESGSISGFLYEKDCRRLLNALDRRLSSA